MIDLQKVAHFLIIVTISVYGLVVAQPILVPLVFAIFLALMLKPLNEIIGKFIPWQIAQVFLTIIIAVIPPSLLIFAFGWQILNILGDLPSITAEIKSGVNTIYTWINSRIHFPQSSGIGWLRDNFSSLLKAPLNFFSESVSSSANLLINAGLVIVYTFLLLLYRKAFRKFLLLQFEHGAEFKAKKLFREIYNVSRGYLYGMLTVTLILGVLNSLGLWLIGVDYPIFWGLFAAILAIVPYIGTFLGGLFPTLYSLAVTTTLWQPLAVIGLFTFIQILEGNFITPKVVGKSVNVNPLAAILALVTGGVLWGAAGLVIAVPVIAIVKIIMDRIAIFKPLSILLSSDLPEKKSKLSNELDKPQYSLWEYFKKDT
ncbi:MAG: AI-2E family transporter [Chitinophagales bacterium]|nr:AI-2E family transporter [Chitinophagales bacterium]